VYLGSTQTAQRVTESKDVRSDISSNPHIFEFNV